MLAPLKASDFLPGKYRALGNLRVVACLGSGAFGSSSLRTIQSGEEMEVFEFSNDDGRVFGRVGISSEWVLLYSHKVGDCTDVFSSTTVFTQPGRRLHLRRPGAQYAGRTGDGTSVLPVTLRLAPLGNDHVACAVTGISGDTPVTLHLVRELPAVELTRLFAMELRLELERVQLVLQMDTLYTPDGQELAAWQMDAQSLMLLPTDNAWPTLGELLTLQNRHIQLQ